MIERFTIFNEKKRRIITTSIGFVSPIDNRNSFLIISNLKGWDVPGGHTEDNESPLQTFEREFFEETGYKLLKDAKQIAIIGNPGDTKTGIAVFTGFYDPSTFSPAGKVFKSRVMSEIELISNYHGDKKLLKRLLKLRKENQLGHI